MENKDHTTSLCLAQNTADRGAGGKLRRPARKPLSTPYARPHQQTRWLSKLVNPACWLISSGLTRIFPSLFFNSPQHSLPAPNNQEQEEYQVVLGMEAEENTEDDGGLKYGESRSTGVSGRSSATNRSKNVSDFDGRKQEKRVDLTDDGFSEIEHLLKGKTFSRDEIDCLIEIIHSRAVDLPEQENKYLSMTVKGEAEKPIPALENPRKGKQEDLSKALWQSSTTILQSSVQGVVGASLVEIAKAYMGCRTSEVGLGSKSILSKDERATLNDDEFALKPFILSPSPKPSTCWPGAMLLDQCGYLTPRTERGRFALHNFPRTPYSRNIFSKSKSKLNKGDANRGLNTTTPLQHLQTPISEQSRRNALDNGHGSVGPIRRTRHKVVEESPARGSTNFDFSLNGSLRVGNSSISEGFFPSAKKNLELGGTSNSSIFQSVDRKSPSSELGVPLVHPHSIQKARTILEHLERNPPTPKDKSAELKLATSWKKTQSSNSTTAMPSERNNFLYLGGLDSCKQTDQGDKKNSAQVNEARVNAFFKVPRESAKEPKDNVYETTSASVKKVDCIFGIQQGGRAGASQNFRRTQNFEIESKNENDSETLPSAANGKVLNLQRKPPSHPVGTKPVLPSISVGKPDQSWTFSSDKNTEFTFPVSLSTGVLSEPPTPSIMPSFAAGDEHQPQEGTAVPSYTFGLNMSTPPLIFTFPSTSSAPTSADASDLKFNFGSDKTARTSFSSIGKDAICY